MFELYGQWNATTGREKKWKGRRREEKCVCALGDGQNKGIFWTISDDVRRDKAKFLITLECLWTVLKNCKRQLSIIDKK